MTGFFSPERNRRQAKVEVERNARPPPAAGGAVVIDRWLFLTGAGAVTSVSPALVRIFSQNPDFSQENTEEAET